MFKKCKCPEKPAEPVKSIRSVIVGKFRLSKKSDEDYIEVEELKPDALGTLRYVHRQIFFSTTHNFYGINSTASYELALSLLDEKVPL